MHNYILETDRLLLRQPTTEDAAFLLRLVNEPSWIRYIGDRNVHTLEDAEKYLLNGSIKSFETNGFGFGIVVVKETCASIGMCGFVKRDFLEEIDIGFAFYPEYTGQGYAWEAASACMRHAREFLGLKKLVAICTQDNASSIRLLEKLGFAVESKVEVEGDELFLFSSVLHE